MISPERTKGERSVAMLKEGKNVGMIEKESETVRMKDRNLIFKDRILCVQVVGKSLNVSVWTIYSFSNRTYRCPRACDSTLCRMGQKALNKRLSLSFILSLSVPLFLALALSLAPYCTFHLYFNPAPTTTSLSLLISKMKGWMPSLYTMRRLHLRSYQLFHFKMIIQLNVAEAKE